MTIVLLLTCTIQSTGTLPSVQATRNTYQQQQRDGIVYVGYPEVCVEVMFHVKKTLRLNCQDAEQQLPPFNRHRRP